MNLVEYVVNKFNVEAEAVDKFKVNLLTILNTTLVTVLSVKGFMVFFDLKANSFLVYFALIGWAYNNFNIYKMWHVSHFIKDIEGSPTQTPDGKG